MKTMECVTIPASPANPFGFEHATEVAFACVENGTIRTMDEAMEFVDWMLATFSDDPADYVLGMSTRTLIERWDAARAERAS